MFARNCRRLVAAARFQKGDETSNWGKKKKERASSLRHLGWGEQRDRGQVWLGSPRHRGDTAGFSEGTINT